MAAIDKDKLFFTIMLAYTIHLFLLLKKLENYFKRNSTIFKRIKLLRSNAYFALHLFAITKG